jgi:hypothetical protein
MGESSGLTAAFLFMCGKCANIANRLSWDRIKAIRETDRYRGSKEHQQAIYQLKKQFKKLKG